MNIPNIKETRHWSVESVWRTCAECNLYTCGTNEDYDRMFDMVRENEPSNENLYLVALDIQKHSKNQIVTNVMYILATSAVWTTFEIESPQD